MNEEHFRQLMNSIRGNEPELSVTISLDEWHDVWAELAYLRNRLKLQGGAIAELIKRPVCSCKRDSAWERFKARVFKPKAKEISDCMYKLP